MAEIVFVTGGSRSGKSVYAQRLAEAEPGPRLYVATAVRTDEEMEERIRRHQMDRRGRGWETIEEPVALADRLRENGRFPVILVDCLTVWINNLLYDAGLRAGDLTEDGIADACAALIGACRARCGTAILVSNEVGMGIVPENPLSRRYRDLAGRCNQIVAAGADRVILLVCGIPLTIKERRVR